MNTVLSERCYGCPGYCGATAFSDPDNQVGFAYAPTKMGDKLLYDHRAEALTNAVYRSMEK